MSLIAELLNAADATVQDPITPRRGPMLLARVVIVRPDIVLIRWGERDRRLIESPQPERGIPSARDKELVSFEQLGQVVGFDGFDNGVPTHGIDAVIKIAVQDADFVVHDHAAVSAADEIVDTLRGIALHGEGC